MMACSIPRLAKAGADVNVSTYFGRPLYLLCQNLRETYFNFEENADLIFVFAKFGVRYDLDENAAKRSQICHIGKKRHMLKQRSVVVAFRILCFLPSFLKSPSSS